MPVIIEWSESQYSLSGLYGNPQENVKTPAVSATKITVSVPTLGSRTCVLTPNSGIENV